MTSYGGTAESVPRPATEAGCRSSGAGAFWVEYRDEALARGGMAYSYRQFCARLKARLKDCTGEIEMCKTHDRGRGPRSNRPQRLSHRPQGRIPAQAQQAAAARWRQRQVRGPGLAAGSMGACGTVAGQTAGACGGMLNEGALYPTDRRRQVLLSFRGTFTRYPSTSSPGTPNVVKTSVKYAGVRTLVVVQRPWNQRLPAVPV